MKTGKFIRWIFFVSMGISIVGAYFKIRHWEGADTILSIGMIATVAYIVSAIYEVQNSDRISSNEKVMWTVAFIFLNAFTGLIYFVFGRKRVIGDSRV